ncbi:MAG TPA: CaiB/BaiF CoA-transferase family protein [Acidimicrobiales bacterium]|nr:CaiB/BaiF CoA-transferase family protein [Acidimicrobiales bacterium]
MPASERTGPLAHLRVLDLSRLYPGAMCSLLLADLGADVVKVEGPGFGDGMRFLTADDFKAAHVAFNRGKRSITLDVKHPRAGELLRRLAPDFDVVIESHRPGALEELGLGYSQLREANPRIIWCSLTGFGPDGPLARAPGHDITYAGYAGVLARLGGGDLPPVPDLTLALPVGALMGAVGILAALARRAVTGQGARVDAALTDAAMWLVSEDVARAASAPGPNWGALAARAIYRCADDRMVTVASTEPKPWAALCAALDLPDLVDHVLGDREDEVTERLAEAFLRKPAADWVQNPGLAGGVGPVNDPGDLLEDAHVAARRGVVALDGDGPRVLASPLRFDGATSDVSSHAATAPPALGAHTDEVLAAAGFAPAEIESFRRDRVV